MHKPNYKRQGRTDVKEIYKELEIDIVIFTTEDVITNSNGTETDAFTIGG